MIRFAGAILIGLTAATVAAEPVVVSLIPPSVGKPFVGQRLPFAVEVGVRGQFSGATVFDLPDVEGAMIIKPEERAIISSRTIDGTGYFIQRHEFSLFSQRAGEVRVPDFAVRCGSVERFGTERREHTATVPGFVVTTAMPPGATPGQLVLTTSVLRIEEQWDPVPRDAMVGDAFRRTVTLEARNLPGMLLPALPDSGAELLAEYESPPGVADETDRGAFTGRRTNEVTYVCERPGDVMMPAIAFRWWNPDQGAWDDFTLPEVRFTVAPDPSLVVSGTGQEQAEAPSGRGVRAMWPAGLLVLAVAGLVRRLLRPARSPEASEFRLLTAACRRGDGVAAYHHLGRWLSLSAPVETSADLGRVSHQLQLAIIGSERAWNGRELLREVKAARKRLLRKVPGSGPAGSLPPLNPRSDELT